MSELDQFHKHELLDRAHCMEELFQTLIADHPASVLVQGEVTKVADALAELFQAAGNVR